MTKGTGSWSGRRRSFPSATRRAILARADGLCQIRSAGCTTTATIADHVVPAAEGGSDSIDNGQAACQECSDVKTRQEIERGRARRPTRKRPATRHPGLRQTTPPGAPPLDPPTLRTVGIAPEARRDA